MGEIEERWVFTDAELENPQNCNREDEFDTGPVPCGPPDGEGQLPRTELGVIVQRNGVVTNRWSDGTVGVSEDIRDMADEIETYYTIEGDNYADNWRNVVLDTETGDFIRFLADGTS